MGFFAPWFLAGLVGIGLPIWLHLLRRHKTEPKPFASLMFFERRTQSSVKHRRLLYRLLMVFRLLMIALLALLFAQPYFRRSLQSDANNRMLVAVVDHTFSMRAGNSLARAKGEIESVLSKRSPGQQTQIIALGSNVEIITQPTTDAAELKAAVEGIAPGDGHSSYGDLARYLRTLAASVKTPIEVHLASDFQKSAVPSFAEMQLPEGTTMIPHRISSGKSPNWAVETVSAPGAVTDPKKVRIAATIRGYETDPAKKTVTLLVNGKTIATKTADVPANGRARVEFVGLDASYGLNRAQVTIDSAGDSLEADNHFYFGFERSEPRKILFAYDARQARALTYFKAALDAAGDSPFTAEAVPCDLTAGQSPSKYAFVVLADCPALPEPFERSLREFVQQGGSLLITLGPSSLSREKVPIANLAVEGSRYAGRDAERFLTAAQVDGGHPVTRTADAFEGVRFYQSAHLKAESPSRILARLSDSSPLLVETPLGEGRVLTFASTIDNVANDFPLHPNFVAFIERSANYLGGEVDKPSSTLVGSIVELRSAKSAAAVEVSGPDGKPVMSLSQAASARTYAFPSEGFFEVKRAGSKAELYAVNPDRRESDLEALPQDTIDLWKNTGNSEAANGGAANLEQAERDRGFSPWRWILFVLLLAAIGETLVGNRYLGDMSGSGEGREKPVESSKEAA